MPPSMPFARRLRRAPRPSTTPTSPLSSDDPAATRTARLAPLSRTGAAARVVPSRRNSVVDARGTVPRVAAH
eukprot:2936835-Prymnesium_polylepis.1